MMQELPCAKGEMVVSRGFTVSYLHKLGERLPVEATTSMSWCCPISILGYAWYKRLLTLAYKMNLKIASSSHNNRCILLILCLRFYILQRNTIFKTLTITPRLFSDWKICLIYIGIVALLILRHRLINTRNLSIRSPPLFLGLPRRRPETS